MNNNPQPEANVVVRPALDRSLLSKLARDKGKTPRQLLSEVLARTMTNAEAARELGCTERSIVSWQRRYNIEVRRAQNGPAA